MNADDVDASHPTRAVESVVLAGPARNPPAQVISVMLASNRLPVLAAWVRELVHTPGIDLYAKPLTDPAGLGARLGRLWPTILLLDKTLLDRLDAPSLQMLSLPRTRTRVILLGDEPCHGLLADVLRHHFHGLLLTTCLPEVALRAIRAVSRGELWLSRAAMAHLITGLLPHTSAMDVTPPGVPAGKDKLHPLTPREQQIVEFLRRGCSNKEIAHELGVMEDTVKKHLQGVFGKLGVHRRALVALRPQGIGERHA